MEEFNNRFHRQVLLFVGVLNGKHREVVALFGTIDKIANSLVHLVSDVDRLMLVFCQEAVGYFCYTFVAKLFVAGILCLVQSVCKEEDGGVRIKVHILGFKLEFC